MIRRPPRSTLFPTRRSSDLKVFCGGIDVGEYTSQRVFQMLDAFHAAFAGMLEVGKPVVCVVNGPAIGGGAELAAFGEDRKSTRLNSSHSQISYAVLCLNRNTAEAGGHSRPVVQPWPWSSKTLSSFGPPSIYWHGACPRQDHKSSW